MNQITTYSMTIVFLLKKVAKVMKMPNKIVRQSLAEVENYLNLRPGQKIKWPTRLQVPVPVGG